MFWKDCKTEEQFKQWFDNYYANYIKFEGREPTVLQVHETCQLWGGPEEGGWWFQCGSPVANYCFFSKEQAFRAFQAIKEEYFSEDTEEEYDFNLATTYAKYYPTKRPHYE